MRFAGHERTQKKAKRALWDRSLQSLRNELNLFGRDAGAVWGVAEGKVCRISLSESMFHAARKTKQQSVRAWASLQHGPLITQEVTPEYGLLCADEPLPLYSH